MIKRSDHEQFSALCATIVEELKTAKFISASPTRAGRYVQVRVRMGKRTGRHSFYQPDSNTFVKGHVKSFLADLCNVYVSANYSITHTIDFQNLLDNEKVLELYEQCHTAACKQVQNCGLQYNLSQRLKAKKALKSWILLAYDHGMKDKDLVELFDEVRVESLLKS